MKKKPQDAQDREIVQALRRVIEESKQSQNQIAKAAGVDQGTLSKFINRKENLGFENFSRLTEYFKLTLCPGKGKKAESH